ncbi:MAG TPA: LON peptidase substrate-binding domain-containing protein [Pseudonocardia sp.]|uniref:LON peptidase substrate-binding domain-containing protein n=1 Tax=Pseudonocardia sp. TaxID=60912 RepID=UPI002B4B6344|nr:LON peptidase substrate-binding domain-containing protein [Pseudonocardia sp.]HLU59516.1 LON peptidase substrate-binding domain-containing protein [Pseudonocardia sp.]
MAETLPLFPLGTVLLPGATLPLHIFEPRYRQLTIDLVTGAVPDREFGVVAVREGWAPDDDGLAGLHAVGCTAVLRDVRQLPDGRFDIVTQGARRFRLIDLDTESKPYLVGSVEPLPDDPADDETVGELIRVLSAAARDAHRRYCTAAWKAGEWAEPDPDVEPGTLPHILVADCLLPLGDRQRLLELTSPVERLRLVRSLLAREASLLSQLRAVPTPITTYAVDHSTN